MNKKNVKTRFIKFLKRNDWILSAINIIGSFFILGGLLLLLIQYPAVVLVLVGVAMIFLTAEI